MEKKQKVKQEKREKQEESDEEDGPSDKSQSREDDDNESGDEKYVNDSFQADPDQIEKLKGTVQLKENKKKQNLKHMLTRNKTIAHLGTAAAEVNEKESKTWAAERECLLLLLHSRHLLRNLVNIKRKNERIRRGDLSVNEVQALLHSQKEDSETDWVQEIQELKRNLLNEVRKNHSLETELAALDKKISLLIKNKNQIQTLFVQKKKTTLSVTNEISSDPKKLAVITPFSFHPCFLINLSSFIFYFLYDLY